MFFIHVLSFNLLLACNHSAALMTNASAVIELTGGDQSEPCHSLHWTRQPLQNTENKMFQQIKKEQFSNFFLLYLYFADQHLYFVVFLGTKRPCDPLRTGHLQLVSKLNTSSFEEVTVVYSCGSLCFFFFCSR